MNFNKWKFSRTSYDDIIYLDDSDLWSNEKLIIKSKDLRLTMVKFSNLLAVK